MYRGGRVVKGQERYYYHHVSLLLAFFKLSSATTTKRIYKSNVIVLGKNMSRCSSA